jgi:SAM-dependent methyltransferase
MERPAYLAVSYDPAKVPFGPYPGQLARWIHENVFRAPGRLLDAGCGRGEFLSGFAALGYTVAGIDVSPKAAELSPSFDVKVTDLETEELPFAEASFDYVFSKSVVEHLRNPDRFLGRLNQALRPGGIAVVMTPSWAHTYWGPFYIDHTHVTPFTVPSLEQALTLAGFAEAEARHFYQLPAVWHAPWLIAACKIVAALPIPYRPFQRALWPDSFNKFVRFSNEVMLLGVARKSG